MKKVKVPTGFKPVKNTIFGNLAEKKLKFKIPKGYKFFRIDKSGKNVYLKVQKRGKTKW